MTRRARGEAVPGRGRRRGAGPWVAPVLPLGLALPAVGSYGRRHPSAWPSSAPPSRSVPRTGSATQHFQTRPETTALPQGCRFARRPPSPRRGDGWEAECAAPWGLLSPQVVRHHLCPSRGGDLTDRRHEPTRGSGPSAAWVQRCGGRGSRPSAGNSRPHPPGQQPRSRPLTLQAPPTTARRKRKCSRAAGWALCGLAAARKDPEALAVAPPRPPIALPGCAPLPFCASARFGGTR